MADDLSLNGKKLISASRASKELGYNSDYIGQLARQKKIPAKLVGRTWFVDIDSLRTHKEKSELSRKEKAKKNFVNTSYLGQTSVVFEPITKIPEEKNFKYESESSPLFPEIAKTEPEPIRTINLTEENFPLKVTPVTKQVKAYTVPNRHLTVTVLTVLAGIALVSALSLSFGPLASEVALIREAASQKVAEIRSSLIASVSSVSPSQTSTSTDGIVIFNDSSDHADKVAQIKSNFSDDVTVIFDKDGQSGVVSPVFRNGSDSDNYAFVLVPLKKK